MTDPVIAIEGFSFPHDGRRRVVSRGQVLPGDDPAVALSPRSFRSAVEVEQGTQAPGEARGLPQRSRDARQAARDAAEAGDPVNGIRHVGGGHYELPNGERVQGKAAAEQRLAELDDGDGDAAA